MRLLGLFMCSESFRKGGGECTRCAAYSLYHPGFFQGFASPHTIYIFGGSVDLGQLGFFGNRVGIGIGELHSV
jgi:hypothetical protein